MRGTPPLGNSDSVQVIRLCWAAITDTPGTVFVVEVYKGTRPGDFESYGRWAQGR
jgi:hypothetical protein